MAKDPTIGPVTLYDAFGNPIKVVEDDRVEFAEGSFEVFSGETIDEEKESEQTPTISTTEGDLTLGDEIKPTEGEVIKTSPEGEIVLVTGSFDPSTVEPLDWVDTPGGAREKPKPSPEVVIKPFKAMPVIILAGGKGTRLAEETQGLIPKPLVKIGGVPMLEHVINIYAQQGMKEFYIATGFMAGAVHKWWTDRKDHYKDRGLEVTPITTGIDTGTGGRLLRLRPHIADRNFMMTYGDGFADVDLMELDEHFQKMGQPVALTAAHPPTRFGNLEIEDGMAIQFGEKTQTSVDWINAGFYIMKPEVFNLMPKARIQADTCRFEFDVLPTLATELKLAAYKHYGFFQMVDSPRDLRKIQLMWEKGDVPWLNWMTL